MNSKTRKHAILSLVAAMCLSLVVAFVPAFSTWSAIAEDTPVAKVGETEYKTFTEALTAADALTGDVTVEIYDKVTLNTSFSGSYDSITFVGKDTDAEIYLDVQGYITATGKTVNFEDLKLSKVQGGWMADADCMNYAFGIHRVKAVNYTNCVFVNGAYASTNGVTFKGCTFYRSWEKYGLWTYGDAKTTVSDCVFAIDRGVKMYSANADVTVTNTDFSAVTDKPAIVLTYGKSVTLAGNDYSDTGVFELDKDGAPNGTAVKSTDAITCVNDDGTCGAIVDGKIYTTLSQAVAAAEDGSVVTLLHNSTETVKVENKSITLDKNGYTAEGLSAGENGSVAVSVARIGDVYYEDLQTALKALTANETLTLLSDVTIATDWDCRKSIPTGPVTIDGNNHTLKFTGKINDGYNHLAVFRFESPAIVKNLTMDLSAATAVFQNRFSAIAAKSDITVESCTFIGSTKEYRARAIIYGEGADTASLNVSVKGCEFTSWGYGVTDEMGRADTASNVTITDSTFTDADALISAKESVTFTGNEMSSSTDDKSSYVKVTSYTNKANLEVVLTGNTLDENASADNAIDANPKNIKTDAKIAIPVVAVMGDKCYSTMDALLEDIQNGNEINLTADVKLYSALVLPADSIFNGNGYTVDGNIVAEGNITFKGYTKVSSFSVLYTGLTVNIVEGATLELTTTGRMTIGSGTTFNITGSIVDAKNTNVAARTAVIPSLIANGASFSGTNLNFNVTNAYLKFTDYCSSKNSGANGTFNFNITNSIWEQTKSFVFSAPTNGMNPTFNFSLKDSVLTTTTHFVVAAENSNVVIDNSNVNVGTSRQLENRGTMTIKNGSVVNAANATSQNATMPGTLIVDNATYSATGEYTGSGFGIGTLIIKNGANVSLEKISKTIIYKETDSTLNYSELADTAKLYLLDSYKFTLDLDKTAIQANDKVNVTVSIDKDYYAAEYTFKYDKTMFTCGADLNDDGEIFVTGKFAGQAGVLATYTLTAKNDLTEVSTSKFEVTGTAIQYVEQTINSISNPITGDTKEIKISLDYTAVVKADYVFGYSLVLVSGADGGYAYDGKAMFFVEAYDAYAIIVKGKVTAENIDAALTKATGCEEIKPSYNVNAELVTDGIVDLRDATLVYACFMQDFDAIEYMELFLRADVNGDKVVDVRDVNAVSLNYTR